MNSEPIPNTTLCGKSNLQLGLMVCILNVNANLHGFKHVNYTCLLIQWTRLHHVNSVSLSCVYTVEGIPM